MGSEVCISTMHVSMLTTTEVTPNPNWDEKRWSCVFFDEDPEGRSNISIRSRFHHRTLEFVFGRFRLAFGLPRGRGEDRR